MEWKFQQEKVAEQGPVSLLRSVTGDELDALEIAPRELIIFALARLRRHRSHPGQEGHGKTWATLATANLLAAGGRLWRWSAPKPLRVLFIDGEMLSRRLKERRKVFRETSGLSPGATLHFLTPDVPGGRVNLYRKEDRQAVERHIEEIGGVDAIVFDNISTLYRATGGESPNSEEWFLQFREWLLDWSQRGVTTVTTVHLGKDAERGSRGTSGIEDVMTVIMEIGRPQKWRATDGARFTIEFAFSRDYGEGLEKCEVSLEAGTWSVADRGTSRAANEADPYCAKIIAALEKEERACQKDGRPFTGHSGTALDESGGNEKRMRKAREHMVEAGTLIETPGEKKGWFRYTLKRDEF